MPIFTDSFWKMRLFETGGVAIHHRERRLRRRAEASPEAGP
jgi:hypothetical protein